MLGQYESMRSMRGSKFLSMSEVWLLRVGGNAAWVTESSVETPVMVKGEDDVGRGGGC